MQDADLSLSLLRRAEKMVSRRGSAWSHFAAAISAALQLRFKLVKDGEARQEAVDWHNSQLEGVSGTMVRGDALNSLGCGLESRYLLKADPSDLDEAIKAFRRAVDHSVPADSYTARR
jgi:hypothetical protein